MRIGESRLNIEASFAGFPTSIGAENKLRGSTNPGGTPIKTTHPAKSINPPFKAQKLDTYSLYPWNRT